MIFQKFKKKTQTVFIVSFASGKTQDHPFVFSSNNIQLVTRICERITKDILVSYCHQLPSLQHISIFVPFKAQVQISSVLWIFDIINITLFFFPLSLFLFMSLYLLFSFSLFLSPEHSFPDRDLNYTLADKAIRLC